MGCGRGSGHIWCPILYQKGVEIAVRRWCNIPIYDFKCDTCGKSVEEYLPIEHDAPTCCDSSMRRIYNMGDILVKEKYPLWVDRMEDIHKAQEQRGERLRMIHPSEVLA